MRCRARPCTADLDLTPQNEGKFWKILSTDHYPSRYFDNNLFASTDRPNEAFYNNLELGKFTLTTCGPKKGASRVSLFSQLHPPCTADLNLSSKLTQLLKIAPNGPLLNAKVLQYLERGIFTFEDTWSRNICFKNTYFPKVYMPSTAVHGKIVLKIRRARLM